MSRVDEFMIEITLAVHVKHARFAELYVSPRAHDVPAC